MPMNVKDKKALIGLTTKLNSHKLVCTYFSGLDYLFSSHHMKHNQLFTLIKHILSKNMSHICLHPVLVVFLLLFFSFFYVICCCCCCNIFCLVLSSSVLSYIVKFIFITLIAVIIII